MLPEAVATYLKPNSVAARTTSGRHLIEQSKSLDSAQVCVDGKIGKAI